jgi:hypothetical protein
LWQTHSAADSLRSLLSAISSGRFGDNQEGLKLSSTVNRDTALAGVRVALDDAITAIESHPPDTVALFRSSATHFWAGFEADASPPPVGFSRDEQRLILHYLLAMSFISAWYHLRGDTSNRDKASQSATTLISTTGYDGETAFRITLKLENLWRESFGEAQGGRR